MSSPVRIKDAHRSLHRVGAVAREGSKHRIYTHPSRPDLMLTLPHHGSGGRPTLSPGLSVSFRKFVAAVEAVRS